MAAPSPSVIARERMEAIEAVRKAVTPGRVDLPAGGAVESEKGLTEQPQNCPKVGEAETEEESVEWTVAPFRGDGEDERRIRGNELCRLLARRPGLVGNFNGLPAIQQMLVLMLQEAVAGEGGALKEKFLEASELKRYKVSQAICSQEGV